VESHPELRRRLHRLRRPAWLGTVRRTTPLSDHWGRERGTPIDRFYIERFLEQERSRVRGRVLEVMNDEYTRRYGTGVNEAAVLDVDESNSRATIFADLAAATAIESERFDCFILTQTLQYVFDLRAAVQHAHRILRPGGTLLCSVPAVSRIGRLCLDQEHWRFTELSCSRLFGEVFVGGSVDAKAHGNVLVAVAFLLGLAAEELSSRELTTDDPFFPVVVTVRATKSTA
jgi:SAM-dependent methyltransferase